MKVKTADIKYLVEKKYDGFRCVAHKDSSGVKLFSDTMRPFNLPKLAGLIPDISTKDFIIDGELVPYKGNEPLGRADLMHIISLGGEAPGIIIRYHVFDIIYFDGIDLTDFPLHKRKAILSHLKFNDVIKNVYSVTVTTTEDLAKAAKLFGAMDGSEGAMIKDYDSTYDLDGTTSAWIKYKVRQKIVGIITSVNGVAGGLHNYTIGIHIDSSQGSRFPSQSIAPINILILGNTFNTSLKFNTGDFIEVEVEEVWRHEWHKDGKISQIRYSIHKPTVIGESKEPSSSIDYLDKLVVSRGQKVIENMELALEEENPDEEGGTRSSAAVGFWDDNWQSMYPKEGKGSFVYQLHWRGIPEPQKDNSHEDLLKEGKHSVHGDLRCSATQDAWGFTVFEGAAKDIPIPPGSKLVKMAEDKNPNEKLQCHPKLRLPIEWIEIGKDEPKLSPPGGVGGTSQNWAKFFAEDWGSYTAGTWRQHMLELFLDGKQLKGRCLITFSPVGDSRVWLISFPKDQTPYAKSHNKSEIIAELKQKGQKFLIWNDPTDAEQPEVIQI